MARRTSEEIAASFEEKAKKIRDDAARREAVNRSEVARRASDAARAVRRIIRVVPDGSARSRDLAAIAGLLEDIVRSEHAARCAALDSKDVA